MHRLIVLVAAVGLTAAITAPAVADPPPVPTPDRRVFCFRVTFVAVEPADPDRFLIEFESLAWTKADVGGLQIARNDGSTVESGGKPFIADARVDKNGRPLGDQGDRANRAPDDGISAPGAPAMDNDWIVQSQTATTARWGGGSALPAIDITDLTMQIPFFEYQDPQNQSGLVQESVDNGPNSLDGFVLVVDDFDPGEVFSFNWMFLDTAGEEFPMSDTAAFGTASFVHRAGDLPEPAHDWNTGFSQGPENFFAETYLVEQDGEVVAELAAELAAGFLARTGFDNEALAWLGLLFVLAGSVMVGATSPRRRVHRQPLA